MPGIGDGIAGAFGDRARGLANDALGIPTAGQSALQYMNEAFPGTTPWERLGSPASKAGTELSSQRNARQLQMRELKTRKDVARIQANAQVEAATVQARPGMLRVPFQNYRDQVVAERVVTLLESEAAKLGAEAQTAYFESVKSLLSVPRAMFDAELSRLAAAAELNAKETGALRGIFSYVRMLHGNEEEPYERAAGQGARVGTLLGVPGAAAAAAGGAGVAGGLAFSAARGAVGKLMSYFARKKQRAMNLPGPKNKGKSSLGRSKRLEPAPEKPPFKLRADDVQLFLGK